MLSHTYIYVLPKFAMQLQPSDQCSLNTLMCVCTSVAVALLLVRRPFIETRAVSNPGGEEEIYFLGRTQKSSQGKGWVRSILLHGPAVGVCNIKGCPLRYAWLTVVSLYTMPQEFPFFTLMCVVEARVR